MSATTMQIIATIMFVGFFACILITFLIVLIITILLLFKNKKDKD